MPGRSYFGNTKEGFTGKETDVETGLQYFGARYYMPHLGRWMAIDPLAEKHPDWTPYNYVLGNPLTFFDPDGRQVISNMGAVNWKAGGGGTSFDPKPNVLPMITVTAPAPDPEAAALYRMQHAQELRGASLSPLSIGLIEDYPIGWGLAAKVGWGIRAARSTSVVQRAFRGTGPVLGTIEVSSRAFSLRAFQRLQEASPHKMFTYLFDTDTKRLIIQVSETIEGNGSPHVRLAQAMGHSVDGNLGLGGPSLPSNLIGGEFQVLDGSFRFTDLSGHSFQNWNSETAQAFKAFLEQQNIRFTLPSY